MSGPRELIARAAAAPQDRKVYFEVVRRGAVQVLALAAVDGIVDEDRIRAARAVLEAAQAEADRIQREYGDRIAIVGNIDCGYLLSEAPGLMGITRPRNPCFFR